MQLCEFATTTMGGDGPLYLGFDLSTQQLKGAWQAEHIALTLRELNSIH
jgi:hypothetical protein